jgi:hypothetical protein
MGALFSAPFFFCAREGKTTEDTEDTEIWKIVLSAV